VTIEPGAGAGPTIPADIVAATATRLAIPFRRPFVTATGTWWERETWLFHLVDATGRTGHGEACLDPAAGPAERERLAGLIRATIPAIAGPGDAAERIERGIGASPDDAVGSAVAAAVVSAMVDLGGPATGAGQEPPYPATTEPSGTTSTVPVNATVGAEDPAATVAAAIEAVQAGFTTLKLKGGREASSRDLVERLAAVRRAVGPGIELRLDVNGAWDLPTARDRLAALADLGLAYVEQPIPPGDPEVFAALRSEAAVPIAADESVTSRRAARALLAADAVDVLVVKPCRVGGIAAATAIVRDAARSGVPVVISTLLETGVGLAVALRAAVVATDAAPTDRPAPAHGLATADLLADDLLAEPLRIASGRMAVPSGPGLGVDVDPAAVDRWTLERVEAGR
jgi:o-succinylbenzoate synthase